MSKVERERKKTCKKCFEEVKCITRWGQCCNRNGGKKVPRFKKIEKANRYDSIRVISHW